MTKVNLRQHAKPMKINWEAEVLRTDITRLTPKMIEYLEYLIPMELGPTPFEKRIGWDCSNTRKRLVELMMEGVLSDKVVNLETRRRRKKKIG